MTPTETRWYEHPGRPITTPGITIETRYGSQTALIRATGTREALKRLQAEHALKPRRVITGDP